MKISDMLLEDCVLPNLKATSKTAAIQELAQALAQSYPEAGVEELTKILLDREKLGSTGIGSGVAIPHGKLASLDKIIAAFGRSEAGVNFDSQDGEPAHLFFVLVAPENSAGMHLKALAKLSRILKNSGFRQKLLATEDQGELYKIIVEEDQKST